MDKMKPSEKDILIRDIGNGTLFIVVVISILFIIGLLWGSESGFLVPGFVLSVVGFVFILGYFTSRSDMKIDLRNGETLVIEDKVESKNQISVSKSKIEYEIKVSGRKFAVEEKDFYEFDRGDLVQIRESPISKILFSYKLLEKGNEVVKEVVLVKVRCPYCKSLVSPEESNCDNCGGII